MKNESTIPSPPPAEDTQEMGALDGEDEGPATPRDWMLQAMMGLLAED